MTLFEDLKTYCASDAYPFHMPGHKRRAAHLTDPASIDITEIDGFDNLHHAEGILKRAQERAAALYGSSETHFLVNGSTAGILSAVGACTRPGSHLLMARNSHRSAYNAAALNRVRCTYLYPAPARLAAGPVDASDVARAQDINSPVDPSDVARAQDINGPIDPSDVARALEADSGICAVFLTSPTYDGVVSDIQTIAGIVHRHNIPLIVDEAHGAHFGMHPVFPESSVALGADLVIHSLHKTLPSLTQTALLHVNGPLVDRGKLRRLLGVYQTSSPSYVLMASIDQCIRLLSEEGPALFDAWADRLDRFYQETKLAHFSFLRTDDPSRILIRPCPPAAGRSAPADASGKTPCTSALGSSAPAGECMSAMELYQILRERFHLQGEMAAPGYVLMLSSVCDDDEGFRRLSDALRTLDREAGSGSRAGTQKSRKDAPDASDGRPRHEASCTVDTPDASDGLPRPEASCTVDTPDASDSLPQPEVSCTIAEALDAKTREAAFSESEGLVSAEYLMLYPPGVPLLVPGERISAPLIRHVLALRQSGYTLQGCEDYSLRRIRVLQSDPQRENGD